MTGRQPAVVTTRPYLGKAYTPILTPRRAAAPGVLLGALLAAACPGPARQGGGPGTAGPPPTAVERPGPARGTARPPTDPPRSPQPQAVRLAKDEGVAIGGGGRVVAPAGWLLTRVGGPGHVVLEEPARELWLALVAVQAPTDLAAIGAAWKRVRPGFAMAVKDTTRPPARDGWDAVTQVVYRTPSGARRVVLALARGKGKRFYVALLDAKHAALGRRGAQLKTILTSLKVPGVTQESFAGKAARPLDAARLQAFEAFVDQARRALDVTGTAVAIVAGGKVIYRKGFGVRRRGAKAPVTPRTLFMIGSITKSLTSMMMAKLVDEKRFTWETPVTTLWKGFALGDPAATARCQMRHTVCACTGLPRQDMEFLFEYKGTTAEGRMKLLATMRPTTAFGETFQYSNLMVSAGGYVAAHAAFPKLKLGAAYLRAMDTRLLRPAGMRRTTFDSRRAARQDHAAPHAPTLELKYVPIPLPWEDTVVSVGPAGGAWSNVEDMARFVLLELGRGQTPEGRRVVSAANLERRWVPGVRIATDQHYGLAMIVNRGRGIRLLGHGGGTLGFSTNMVFLPDHGVGLVSLTNNGGGSGGFNSLILRRLLELLFGAEPRAAQALAYVVKKQREGLAKALKRIDLAPPAAWVRQHAGTYRSDALGRLTIKLLRGKGVVDAGEWQAALAKHTAKDGVVRLLIGAPLAGLALEPGTQDGRRILTLRTAQQKYVFVDVAKPRAAPRPRTAPRPRAARR